MPQFKKEDVIRARAFFDAGSTALSIGQYESASRIFREGLAIFVPIEDLDDIERVKRLCLKESGKIGAIRVARAELGLALKDAKEWVDGFWEVK